MGSKAIHADAPIFLRASVAATTAILADVSSIVAKERPGIPISKSPSNGLHSRKGVGINRDEGITFLAIE